MWTIELGFITGVMVGIEFISKEDSGESLPSLWI